MAAKKKAKNKTRQVRRAVRLRRRFSKMGLKERAWWSWNHDLDSLLHELVKNPELVSLSPVDLVDRAAEFADALHNLLDRRRPPGVKYD